MTMTATRTTEKTGMNHGIHGTINVTLIKVRAIIYGPPKIVVENLPTLNLEDLSHTRAGGQHTPRTALHFAYTPH